MLTLSIQATDIEVFRYSMETLGARLDTEFLIANQAIASEGVAIAQELAPRDDGHLAGSIALIGAVTADGAEFGTSVIYAWQREEGGTIYGNPWLVFPGRDGGLVFVREVTQKGTHYMANTVTRLEPFAMVAWGNAIERTWDGI